MVPQEDARGERVVGSISPSNCGMEASRSGRYRGGGCRKLTVGRRPAGPSPACLPSAPATRHFPRNNRRDASALARTSGSRSRVVSFPWTSNWHAPPIDGDSLIGSLSRRAVPGVERSRAGSIAGACERRAATRCSRSGSTTGARADACWVAPATIAPQQPPRRHVAFWTSMPTPAAIDTALGAGWSVRCAARSPAAASPAVATPAEIAIRAVIGRRCRSPGAAAVAGRLCIRARPRRPARARSAAVTRLSSPAPCALAQADPQTLPMPRARARALAGSRRRAGLGRARARPGAPVRRARRAAGAPGCRPWTADYVAMRALGDRDAFLATDLGVRRALEGLGEDACTAARGRGAQALSRALAALPRLRLPAPLGNPGGPEEDGESDDRHASSLYARFDSPMSELLAVGDDRALTELHMQGARPSRIPGDWTRDDKHFGDVRQQLGRVLRRRAARVRPAGALRRARLGIPAPRVGPASRAIPYGETRTYGELAHGVGDRATRVRVDRPTAQPDRLISPATG